MATTAAGTWVVSPFSGMGLVVGEQDHYLLIVFEDGDHMTHVPAGIEKQRPWSVLDREPASPEVVAEWRARGEAKRAEESAARKAEQDEYGRREREWKAWLQESHPAGAVAIVVAEQVEDDCDSMTDHYGTKTLRRVFLGWSFSTRVSFKEFRRVAAGSSIPEVADLSETGKEAEHRENYSMGKGLYLKDGGTYDSGWEISKERVDREWQPRACEVEARPMAQVIPIRPVAAVAQDVNHDEDEESALARRFE